MDAQDALRLRLPAVCSTGTAVGLRVRYLRHFGKKGFRLIGKAFFVHPQIHSILTLI